MTQAAERPAPPVVNTDKKEVVERFEKAREAHEIWRKIPVPDRVAMVRKFWAAILERKAELMKAMHEDAGKPELEIEVMEIAAVETILKHFTRNAERLLRDQVAPAPWVLFNKKSYIRYVPRGVVGLITPWNMPLLIPFGDSIPALLAGNAVVIKPSEWTTKTALFLEKVATSSGLFPEGLFQVVPGDGEVGRLMPEHSDMILFTGSTATGRRVAVACAERLIPCVLELGGKHPMIVLKNAPLKRAAKAAAWGSLANMGQICVGVERIYVERAIHDRFVAAVRAEVLALRQNDDPCNSDLGRFIFPPQLDHVLDLLADARAKGAKVEGGEVVNRDKLVMRPAIVTECTPEMRIMKEETFGPVVVVMPVSSEDEAVRLANDTRLGLAASVWTADTVHGEWLSHQLDAGLVGVNDVLSHYAVCALPFGGVKDSGLGRRHGDEGLRMFCETQSVMVHEWPSNAAELWWYPYDKLKAKILNWVLRLS